MLASVQEVFHALRALQGSAGDLGVGAGAPRSIQSLVVQPVHQSPKIGPLLVENLTDDAALSMKRDEEFQQGVPLQRRHILPKKKWRGAVRNASWGRVEVLGKQWTGCGVNRTDGAEGPALNTSTETPGTNTTHMHVRAPTLQQDNRTGPNDR